MSVSDSGGGQVTGPRLQHVVLYCSMVLRTLTEKLSPDETRCKHFITEKGHRICVCFYSLISVSGCFTLFVLFLFHFRYAQTHLCYLR